MAESNEDHNKFFIKPSNSLRYRHIISRRGVSGYLVVFAVIVVVLINMFLIYMYRKHNQKKVNEQLQAQVNSAVSQYFRLADNDPLNR